MLKSLLKRYFAVPLVWRVLCAFIIGIIGGFICSQLDNKELVDSLVAFISPFGTIMISMLKMIVIPIIFFTLIIGASSLPLKKFGRLGVSVIVWYFVTSLFAGLFGIVMALMLNPKMEQTDNLTRSFMQQVDMMRTNGASSGLSSFLSGLFMNPFQALAQGQFLPIIIFAILFGLTARVILDRHGEESEMGKSMTLMLKVCDAIQRAAFTIIDWVMEYFPIGVLSLTFVNFTVYGPSLFIPYMQIALCVVIGVLLMIFAIYPLALFLLCRENPFHTLNRIKEAIITAFLTRSSAATLPVSMRIARDKLHVRDELSSFALPLGATINMDGVCIHLPVFAILAANIFNVPLNAGQLTVLLISVVFASVGAGGIPGGSVFLLFMVLSNMGLTDAQVATIVALAIGINPILDMFETACNVTGDNVCNYIIARRNKLIQE